MVCRYRCGESLVEKALDVDLPTPFKRMSFREALDRYGIDKPDTLRHELADSPRNSCQQFQVFSGAVANGGV